MVMVFSRLMSRYHHRWDNATFRRDKGSVLTPVQKLLYENEDWVDFNRSRKGCVAIPARRTFG